MAALHQGGAQLVELAVQLLHREFGLDVDLKILIRLKPVLRGLPILAFCATDAAPATATFR